MKQTLALALLGVVLAGCGQNRTPPSASTMGGASTTIEGGTIQSASLWIKEGSVAIAVAPAQPGQKDLEFSWVALIRHDYSSFKNSQSISMPLHSDGRDTASAGFKMEINGKSFELVERFRIDPKAKTLTYEELQVNGKKQDLKAGRVFLVDLTAQPPTVEQRAVDLSGPAAVFESIEAVAFRARDKVTQSDEAARKFVAQMK